MANTDLPPFRGYTDPIDLVDRTEIDYSERLVLLQAWQAEVAAAGGSDEQREALTGAIQALETGAALQGDGDEEVPVSHGYGVHNKG